MASLLAGASSLNSLLPRSIYCRVSFYQSQTLGTALSSSSASVSLVAAASSPSLPLDSDCSVYCRRVDKKTAKGKRFNHSFGNARPRNKNKGRGPPSVPIPPSPPKDKFEDNEKIKININESFFNG